MYGAMWAAALIAAAFTAPTVRHAVDQALAVIRAGLRHISYDPFNRPPDLLGTA